MAPKKPTAKAVVPKTRTMGSKNLRDILNGFQQAPDDPSNIALKQMSKDVVEQIKAAYTYEYASDSTQNRRNLHLDEYTNIIKATVKVNETNGDEHEDWEERLWGKDYIADNLRAYVLMISQVIQPRAYKSESIKFATLAARRQSMMHWVIQKCESDIVSLKDVYNGSNRALYMAFRKNNLSIHPPPKFYANKDDIRNLIEYVTYAEGNIEMAQQMVIAWLMGFICGVRPGSIGASRNRLTHYLRWEDIEISRTTDGNFKLFIVFKWLKGYNDEKLRPLRFSVSGPKFTEDVMFSLPHRLLALALRRGFLAHYDTLDELMEDTRTKITFKSKALKDPVVLASSPKGLSLQPGKAALASGLTTYLQRSAFDFGLPPNVTMYIWRRSAGSAVGRALGDDKGGEFLSHNMGSGTYKGSYAEGTIAMDVMSIAMGRQMQTSAELAEDETLSVNRIKDATNNKVRWIKKYIAEHPENIKRTQELQAAQLNIEEEGGEARFIEARNMRDKVLRNLRNQAAIAFQEVELQLVKENMTAEELETRRKDVKAVGEFEAKLKKAADDARKAAEDEFGLQAPVPDLNDVADVRERAEQIAEDEDENEAARQLDDRATIEVNGMSGDRAGDRTEDGADDDAPNTGASAKSREAAETKAVRAAGHMILDLLVNQESKDPSEQVNCQACVVDPTVPDTLSDEFVKDPSNKQKNQFKEKLYKKADLARHLAGDFHSPKNKWYRSFGDNKTEYKCPYGGGDSEEAEGEGEDEDEDEDVEPKQACDFVGQPRDILKHCLRSKGQSDQHLLDAAKAGIFAIDFDPAESRKIGKVVAKGGNKGYKHEAFGDPDTFDLAAFVPPRNITNEGEVEEDDSVEPYSKTVRLPPNAELVESTLYKEHPEALHGHIADTLQQQRSFLARRADAILRQHGAEQTEKGETQSRASKGKGKRKLQGIAANRERLTELGFDWVAGAEDLEEVDGDSDAGAGEEEAGGAEDDDDE